MIREEMMPVNGGIAFRGNERHVMMPENEGNRVLRSSKGSNDARKRRKKRFAVIKAQQSCP
jgi:hypothetical protein